MGLCPHLRSVLSSSPWGLGFPQAPPLQRDERPRVQAAGIGECREERCSHAVGPGGRSRSNLRVLAVHPRSWVPPLEGGEVPCERGRPPEPLVTRVSVLDAEQDSFSLRRPHPAGRLALSSLSGPASLRLEALGPPCCSLAEAAVEPSPETLESFTGELPPSSPSPAAGFTEHHSGSAHLEFSAPLTVVGLRFISAYLIIIKVFK